MKKELTISQRGEIAQQIASGKHFYTDLKLYNEYFPGSKQSVQFTKVNEHNIDSLHNRMLYDLLSKVDQDDIINNRLTPLERANKKKADIKAAKEAEKQATEDAKVAIETQAQIDAEILISKENATRSNIISQIRTLLKNNIPVEDIHATIGNQPVSDEFVVLTAQALSDLVDTTVELWKTEPHDAVKVDVTNAPASDAPSATDVIVDPVITEPAPDAEKKSD